METPNSIDVLIIRLFSGEADPDEKKKIAEWFEQSPENKKLYADLREIWLSSGIQSNADNYDLEDAIRKFRDQISMEKYFQPLEQEVTEQRLDLIQQKIRISDKTIKLVRRKWQKYAAGIAIFITIGSLIWLSVQTKNRFPFEAANMLTMKGKIILANGSTREFDTEQTTIKQTSSGNVTINNDTIDIKSNKTPSATNQIIIPYGKRSEIMLADGTHIWLNSGSQLSYPTKFKTDSREVFLSGEAFFEVKANPNKPFYVITRDIRIKVLGTSFNVCSYIEDNTTQTVLFKGKVSAGKDRLFAKTIDMMPGERLIYDKSSKNLIKDRVDVKLYSSWVNGFLNFDNTPITEVYKKLERYYNKNIKAEDDLGKISFSGKLDLKNKIEDVLENISFASSVKVRKSNGSFIIKK